MAAILILDTCAILDLVRAPVRREFNVSYAGRARAILAAAKRDAAPVRMMVSDVVREEFARNLPNVIEETKTKLMNRCGEYRHALAVVAGYSDVPATHSVDDRWVEENIRHGQRLAEDFLATSVTELATDQDQLRANGRVRSRVPPAEFGNNNLADCVITEVALRVAKASNSAAAEATKVVLFSSNTADFCDTRHLKPALQAEFDAVALQYVRNWGEAWAATVR